jgi:hypothetical protein
MRGMMMDEEKGEGKNMKCMMDDTRKLTDRKDGQGAKDRRARKFRQNRRVFATLPNRRTSDLHPHYRT